MPDDRAPLEVETALYRITQEALHNVVKHAEANAVTIKLAGSAEDGLRLTVQDDGTGFDPAGHPGRSPGHRGHARASQPDRRHHRCRERGRVRDAHRGAGARGAPPGQRLGWDPVGDTGRCPGPRVCGTSRRKPYVR